MATHDKRATRVTIIIVFVLCTILISTMFCYQIHYTEHAVVLRFGKPIPIRNTTPGIHFKWPFESVWRVDNRVHCTEGTSGAIEEVFTSDGKNVVISVFVGWRVSKDNVFQFMERIGSIDRTEVELTTLIRSFKNGVIGRYRFEDLVNIDPTAVRIKEIEREMLDLLKVEALKLYGVEVEFLGINHVGLPESVTADVFDRMKSERNTEVQRVLSEGEAIATKIRAEADRESAKMIADADSQAKLLRAEGDAEAARNYSGVSRQP